MILGASADTLPGAVTLIQLGFVGVAVLWFATGNVYPKSTVTDLREQIAQRDKIIEAERADSKAIRDAIIRDVAPIMARTVDRDKEIAELVSKLLAWALAQERK